MERDMTKLADFLCEYRHARRYSGRIASARWAFYFVRHILPF